jgi:hypothetical protein
LVVGSRKTKKAVRKDRFFRAWNREPVLRSTTNGNVVSGVTRTNHQLQRIAPEERP